ncbi:MAG: salicylate hydroxylase [Candidatus Azotimanducaceae bacterium]|jgi:salicylate hydroxylase
MQLANTKHILIAGGGIGGTTAALCLAAEGFQVSLLEQSAELVETGAGIQLSPNCTRVLHGLGLEQALRACSFLPEGTQFRQWQTGKIISESILGESLLERYGAPYYHIHRGDLMQVLANAADNSPNISLHTNARVTGFEQDGNSVTVLLEGQKVNGDILIGADGIHSLIREQLWGVEQPAFTGNVAWRALVPSDQLPKGLIRPMSTVWWGPGKHFVHYYVRGGDLVNCVCVVEKTGWEVESWTESGDVSELHADFSGWHGDIQQLIDHIDDASLYKWALFDRAPMSQWGIERVTLLGDACHPTLPFMAQGAAMAIEDAAVLANCLSAFNDATTALQRYETLRKSRTASIQRGSRRNAKVFHLSGIPAFFRDRAARAAGDYTLDKLFRYNALEEY